MFNNWFKKPQYKKFKKFMCYIYFTDGKCRSYGQRITDEKISDDGTVLENWPKGFQELADWWLRPYKKGGQPNDIHMWIYSRGVNLLHRDHIRNIVMEIEDHEEEIEI